MSTLEIIAPGDDEVDAAVPNALREALYDRRFFWTLEFIPSVDKVLRDELHKLGGVAEVARDLAYRLYTLCERKKWAEEALAYNGLVIAWPELSKLALAERNRPTQSQQEMFS